MRQMYFGWAVGVCLILGVGGCGSFVNSDPRATLSVDNDTIPGKGGVAVITARLDAMTSQPVTIQLAYSGTAISGVDYTRSSTTITIPAFKTTATVRLTALNSAASGADLAVVVDAVSISRGTLDAPPITVTITNSNDPSLVSLTLVPASGQATAETSISEPDDTMLVQARLSNIAHDPVTVHLAFSGTAVQDSDYSVRDTPIVIPAGKTSGSATIQALGRDGFQGERTIVIRIDSIEGIAAEQTTEDGDPQQVTIRLEDDAPAPTVTLAVSGTTMSKDGGTASITATLAEAIPVDATIDFTLAGTAVQDTDYSVSGTQIVIPAGQTTGQVTFTGLNNPEQGNKVIEFDAAATTNATPSGQGTFQISILDPSVPSPEAAGEAFLADNATKPGVQVTASGLQYKVLTEGTGPRPSATDTVEVKYTGTLIDGTQFDTSGDQTVTFKLNEVIAGWTEGVQLMPTGSQYLLYIPYGLAYGANGSPPKIPPYSALIFDVTLVSIK